MMTPLNPKRGIEDFIDAAAIVSWRRPDVRFLIIGEKWVASRGASADGYGQRVVDRISRLGLRKTVLLMESRSDLLPLLLQVTVSILPWSRSRRPRAPLESRAADPRLVATRVEGAADAAQRGVTGLLVPPGDPQELATAMGQLLD